MSLITRSLGRARALITHSGFPYRSAPTPNGVAPAPQRSRLGSDFDTAWARRYPARLTRAALVEGIMRPTMTILADPRVYGQDRLEQLDGPVIFAANHHSHADTPLMLTTIPDPWRHRMVVGAAADYFFGTRIGGTIAALTIGAIPIERTKVEGREYSVFGG